MKKIAFHTLGCKLNFAETSSISRQSAAKGYTIVDFHAKADVYVIHSCLVTAAAERKTIAAVKQSVKRNPEARVAVIGCMPELNPERLKKMEGVDLILGNDTKFNLYDYLEGKKGEEIKQDHEKFIPSWSVNERTRSFLKVQDGCDYFCAYCTIPLARGRSRSNTVESTLATAREIAAQGVREIVLTGINIGDFGRHQGESLYELLVQLENIGGIERIRISSIEPDLLEDRIIELTSKSPKLLPHFHIPLQSGSDHVLKLMNRKYSLSLFESKVRKIKELMPLCCIATDIIAGYPGESENDFSGSVNFLRDLDISYMHVFTYSERANTKALKAESQVPPEVRKKRSEQLHELSEQKKNQFYLLNKGRTAQVFFESENKKGYLYGFTENYVRARHPWRREMANRIVSVKLDELADDGTFNTILSETI